MKYLFLILLLGSTLKCLGQDPQLLDNTWYLQKVISEGDETFPPSSDFITEAHFFLDIFDYLYTFCNLGWVTDITYDSADPLFDLGIEFNVVGDGCVDPVLIDFMDLHNSIYYIDNITPLNPFMYDIIMVGSDLQLTVTNVNGDSAIYGNRILSVDRLDFLELSIYPNPINNELLITCECQDVEYLQIIDVGGKVVFEYKEFNLSNTERIDLAHLKSGIYFLTVDTDVGQVTKKIIKK